jgi:magnesium-transporting ATPase (P-type)
MPETQKVEDFTDILKEIRSIIAEDLGDETVAQVEMASNNQRSRSTFRSAPPQEAAQRLKVVADISDRVPIQVAKEKKSSVPSPSTKNRDQKRAKDKANNTALSLHWLIVVVFFVGSACPIVANYYINHPQWMAQYPISARQALGVVVMAILVLAYVVLFCAVRYLRGGFIPHSNIWTAWPVHEWPTKVVATRIAQSTRPVAFWSALCAYFVLCAVLIAFAYYFESLIMINAKS